MFNNIWPQHSALPLAEHQLSARNDGSNNNGGTATIVSVVFITMPPSFTGSTAGFATRAAQPTIQSSDDRTARQQTMTAKPDPSTRAQQSSTVRSSQSNTQLATMSTQAHTSSRSLLIESASAGTIPTAMVGTPISAAHTSSSTDSSSSGGMSSASKGGLAIGILLALGIIAGAVFVLLRKKRAARGVQKLDDEKSFVSPGPQAPRLSLGPAILPGFAQRTNGRLTSATGGLSTSPQKQDRLTVFPSAATGSTMPFVTPAETAAAADRAAENAPIPVVASTFAPSDPFADRHAAPTSSFSTMQPGPIVGSVANTPTPKAAMPSNVHRVQLDFQPTMDDELELLAGQVVRIMHEYDDGWALCMRMDRSKQGVAPRTCLSKLPIKPRLANPPPLRPSGQQGPAARRMSPPAGSFSQAPYPATGSMRNSSDTSSQQSIPLRIAAPVRRKSLSKSLDSDARSDKSSESSQGFSSPIDQHGRSSSEQSTVVSPVSPSSQARLARKPVPGAAR